VPAQHFPMENGSRTTSLASHLLKLNRQRGLVCNTYFSANMLTGAEADAARCCSAHLTKTPSKNMSITVGMLAS
jgi:hypothetical protein